MRAKSGQPELWSPRLWGESLSRRTSTPKKRFASRGITLEWTQNIIDNADFALKQRKGTQYAFYTSEGFAVLDNNGEIGTAGQLDERGKLLYDEVMKHVRAK